MDENFMKELVAQAEQAAKEAKRKAMRILIPTVVTIGLVLIGIGIIIGKFLL